jgi:hypothetical protein
MAHSRRFRWGAQNTFYNHERADSTTKIVIAIVTGEIGTQHDHRDGDRPSSSSVSEGFPAAFGADTVS